MYRDLISNIGAIVCIAIVAFIIYRIGKSIRKVAKIPPKDWVQTYKNKKMLEDFDARKDQTGERLFVAYRNSKKNKNKNNEVVTARNRKEARAVYRKLKNNPSKK